MKSLFKIIAAVSAISLIPVSASAAPPKLTPLQIQAMQQREVEGARPAVFSSVVDVFQDLGYTINSADLNTGFITAESATVEKTSLWDALGGAMGSGNTRATAFVELLPNGKTRVRLNFVSTKTLSGGYGQSYRQDSPILDPAVYQTAFEKVEEALFVRRAMGPSPATPPPEAASETAAPQ